LDETPRRSDLRVCDVAAALLRLAPNDRHAFIPSLIVILERVVADEERHRADRELMARPAHIAAGRNGRLAREPALGVRDTTMER
jgi:hypothetical protein